MDSYWKDYLEEYVNEPFYWWQPKGFTIKRSNLLDIKKKLNELQRFDGKRWRTVQRPYARALHRAGLFGPRTARPRQKDYPAIVRMNKEVFDCLGLCWVNKQSVVVVTQAGREFLSTKTTDLPKFVENQLLRYQLPNPAVGKQGPDAGVFPYLALLSVLNHFPGGISSECYELFIARIRNPAEFPKAVARIQRYEALADKKKEEVEHALEKLPIIRDGRIVLRGRRTSLLNTIRLDRSYMLGLLMTPRLIVEDSGRLKIDPDRHAEGVSLVQRHLQEDCYIRFSTSEDWIAFYGESDQNSSYENALLYHRRRGDSNESLKTFRAAKAKNRLPSELKAMPLQAFRNLQLKEKNYEDFLILNLAKLEFGLRFVARQYPTSTGPLDILAKDRQKRWVVLELKRGRAGDKVVGQLLRYRGFIVSESASGAENRVRGFVVSPVLDKKAIAAVRGAGTLPLEVHQFVIEGHANRLYPN